MMDQALKLFNAMVKKSLHDCGDAGVLVRVKLRLMMSSRRPEWAVGDENGRHECAEVTARGVSVPGVVLSEITVNE